MVTSVSPGVAPDAGDVVTSVSPGVAPDAGDVVTTSTGVRARPDLGAGMDVHVGERRVLRAWMTHRVVGQPVESHEYQYPYDQT
jgi:hypothetical protein